MPGRGLAQRPDVCKPVASAWRGAKVTLKARAYCYLGAFSASCVLLAACTPANGTIPTPPATSSPASAIPPETAQEREERLAYEAAEKAYRTFRAEYDRLYQIPSSPSKPPKAITQNAAGPYLKVMMGFLTYSAERNRRADRAMRIAYVRPGGYSLEELVLETCEDGSRIRVLNPQGKQVGHGGTSALKLIVRRVDGRWKVWDGDQTVVARCAE